MNRYDIAESPGWTGTLARCDESTITDIEGWSLGIPADSPELIDGSLIEYWGKGLGFVVRGLAVGGHVLWYRTESEQEAHDTVERERRDTESRADFERDLAKHDASYNALPETFRARVDRFRSANPDFRWQFEPYEVMCCTDALKIASWCSINRVATQFEGDEPTAAENVLAFQKLRYEQQKAAGIDEGHSGNSFGFACRLAYLWVTDPGLVEFEHGALTPLVGCDNYGCTHDEQVSA